MNNQSLTNCDDRTHRSGVVLLVTLVLLVVLATLGYTLSSKVSAQRRRSQYIMDYQAARYGCDSAVKYALTRLQDISPSLIGRPNVPDFSDLFHLSEPEYQELLDELAAIRADERGADANFTQGGLGDIANITDDALLHAFNAMTNVGGANDLNDVNDTNDVRPWGRAGSFNDPNLLVIPGPYGPAWPYVTEPIELEIGSAKVTIEIEDENAKYPIGWMLTDDDGIKREVLAGFENFCEWMDVNEVQIYAIEDQLEQLSKEKPFQLKFREITKRERVTRPTTASRRTVRRPKTASRRYVTTKVSPGQQVAEQAADFSRVLHSSLIDTETLARPTIVSETREEAPLKYIGIWGSAKVNVNTAPRHVLEAAFTFGGDAVDIAQEIILRRRQKPFKDIADLKNVLFSYSDSIRECEQYITTRSTFFTIRVTAVSGAAEASAVIAITKDEKKTNRIAMISG